jgi:lipoprotein-releasing system permease protein
MSWILRLLGWDTYQGFVARRYLLVRESKIKPAVRYSIIALFLARMVLIPVGLVAKSELLWGINRIVEGVFIVVLVFGVLRHSKFALWAFIVGLVISSIGGTLASISTEHAHSLLSPISDQPGVPQWFGTTTLIIAGIGGLITFLATFFGTLRAGFTFFTTVPIGGVWIGTMALVCVLSVMSGFESDLRNKILGSNAHIQVTREDGDISNWRQLKATIDKVPGVVASTPYAQSEVVVAANTNGQNVIIKGIDPKTVGNVTKLVDYIDDTDKPAALKRLEPLVDDNHDLGVKQRSDSGSGVDPSPTELPSSDQPIDFSQPAFGSDAGSAGSAGSAAIALPIPAGSAVHHYELIGSDVLGSDDPSMHLPIDASFDAPSMSRRTQALPGILVGRELVKQTHLYQGEEVRVVSPLSDPSNPDATGTPIPFNRDYRVAGIFFTGMYEYDLKYVYVSLDSFQEFLDRGDAVDGIEVRIHDPDDSSVADRIRTALGPSYSVKDWKELNRSLFSALKLEKVAMFIVLGIVILVASFSIVGNLIMVVVEKQREIALLKTLGASDNSVMQLFAIQGLMIGLIGTTLGVLFGLGACYLGKHYGIPLNPNVYYIDRMPVHVDASSVIVTFLAGVVISIAATFYPAMLAAQIRPAAGIRH